MKVSYRAARVNAGMNLAAAANGLGVTSETLRNYELGTQAPKAGMILAMASLYGCKTDDFRENPVHRKEG